MTIRRLTSTCGISVWRFLIMYAKHLAQYLMYSSMYAKHLAQDLMYSSWSTTNSSRYHQYDGTSLKTLSPQCHKKLRFLHIITAAKLSIHSELFFKIKNSTRQVDLFHFTDHKACGLNEFTQLMLDPQKKIQIPIVTLYLGNEPSKVFRKRVQSCEASWLVLAKNGFQELRCLIFLLSEPSQLAARLVCKMLLYLGGL